MSWRSLAWKVCACRSARMLTSHGWKMSRSMRSRGGCERNKAIPASSHPIAIRPACFVCERFVFWWLQNATHPDNDFKQQLKVLLKAHPNVDVTAMGFPANISGKTCRFLNQNWAIPCFTSSNCKLSSIYARVCIWLYTFVVKQWQFFQRNVFFNTNNLRR